MCKAVSVRYLQGMAAFMVGHSKAAEADNRAAGLIRRAAWLSAFAE